MTGQTSRAEDGLAYAREVYAACATVGFSNGQVTKLKRLLDEHDAGYVDIADLVAAAQSVQLASIAWVSR